MAKRLAVIFHKNERKSSLPRFAIWHLADVWWEQNIDVTLVFGTRKFVPADAALLHIDLTTVPEEYMDFAARYPVVINGGVKSIRKSSFSDHKVKPGDGYNGKVIVKSELNYAGQPERKLLGSPLSRLALRISCRIPALQSSGKCAKPDFNSPQDYQIFDNPGLVPAAWFEHEDILVEKFVPEMRSGLYCVRSHHFLGDHGVCVLRKSPQPIVNNAAGKVNREEVDPDPEIVMFGKRMGFDYGKFDYVMHEGRAVLLDTNKTPGAGRSPAFFVMCREWAKGIRKYL